MADTPSGKTSVPRVHVLTLSEESAHVRSLARSWAAGEVGLDDYRMIRSMTIEGMLNGEIAIKPATDAATENPQVDDSDDDDDHDITAVGDQTVAEADDTDPNVEVVNAPPPTPAAAPLPRLALIAGGALLVLGIILLCCFFGPDAAVDAICIACVLHGAGSVPRVDSLHSERRAVIGSEGGALSFRSIAQAARMLPDAVQLGTIREAES